MSPLIRTILIAAGAAIVGVVVFHQFFASTTDRAWEALSVARMQGTVPALESARDQVSGGPVRPWIDYELAMTLYAEGGSDNLERAKQVAEESLRENPDHVTAAWLQRLITAVSTFRPTGQG